MIEFVELKDGRVFNGDTPYVFWFENGQSVNLNYVRKICFISDYRQVRARIDSEVFSLLRLDQNIPEIIDPLTGSGEIINEKQYIDLNLLKTNVYTSVGFDYNGIYVHMIYILANSQTVGEIHDYFTITENHDNELIEYKYEIAADFYADNELLKNQLENFDISIPESIQKAIYDVDVHEEANDNITLNRKYKELLMNYWDIVANKGSYNSLQNSLAWFEWGDLVRIEEFWNRHYEGMKDYFLTKLNTELDDDFIKQFLNNSKTTYIGLYMALSRISRTKNGDIEYEIDNGQAIGADPDLHYQSEIEHLADNNEYVSDPIPSPYTEGGIIPVIPTDEYGLPIGNYVYVRYEGSPVHMVEVTDYSVPGHLILITEDNITELSNIGFAYTIEPRYIYNEINPRLEIFSTRWQALDLCLKMTLLGNFYATYFVPIHIDVIHSAVEQWVFTNTVKLLHTDYIEEYNMIDRVRTFDMEWDRVVKMRDYKNKPYSDTLFLSDGGVFGFENIFREEPDENFTKTGEIFRYMTGGCYGVADFRTVADSPMIATGSDDIIIYERMVWSCGKDSGEIVSQIPISPIAYDREGYNASQYIYDFSFKLGFLNPGDYNISFEFHTTSGNIWTKTISISVEDTIGNHVKMYKVRRLEKSITDTLEPDNNWKTWLNAFQMTPAIDIYNNPLNPPADTHLGTARYELEYHPYKEHSIYIKPFDSEESIGLSHTVIFDIHVGLDIDAMISARPEYISPIADYSDLEYKLNDQIPEYIWIINEYPMNEFRVIGICREYDVEKIEGLTIGGDGDVNKYVMGMRFHPCMHMIEDYDNSDPISSNDLIYIEPYIRHSKDISVDNWEFYNVSKQKSFTSYLTELRYYPDGKNYGDFGNIVAGGMQGYMMSPQKPVEIEAGYYNIYIYYKTGDELMRYAIDSALLVNKK